MDEKLLLMEEQIGYVFQKKELLEQALTHSSYANELKGHQMQNNERLEFLGDAVLELVASTFLFEKFPEKSEGELSRTRASIVCEQSLFYCARMLRLGDYLYLGKGEAATGGRNRASIVSDAMEAMIGAIYLDSGITNARQFILRFILNDFESKQLFYDAKTILQERVQHAYSDSLVYTLMRESGPDHDKRFHVEVSIGEKVIGSGEGRSKKSAEQSAAYHAILSAGIGESICS